VYEHTVDQPDVGVIMPTLGTSERAPLLRRALESVLSQDGVQAVPVVVFNGPAVDASLLGEVRRDPRVQTLVLEEADLPAALLAGRRQIEQPWFAELDDDDELLPGALSLRLRTLIAAPDRGAVVTNGIRRGDHSDIVHIPDVRVVEEAPLRQLLERNWLLPGSWLCRTEVVADSAFAGIPRFLECTYLAVRLASTTRLAFVQEPTLVYHDDTPSSESKSLRYVLGQEAALQRILELDLPPDVRRLFELRLAPACWAAAHLLAGHGDMRAASGQWLRALRHPGGWRHLPKVPRLLWPRTST
jgi:glycosyltransferase involved in cell wall biosynthesis